MTEELGTNTVLGAKPERIAEIPKLLERPKPGDVIPGWDGSAGARARRGLVRPAPVAMRVLILDTVYGAFLDSHYRSIPVLDATPYDEQWRALMDTHFATADAYSHNLAKAGVAAHEVVVDCRAPAAGLGARARRRRSPGTPLVLEQVRWFEPDVVYLQNLNVLETRRSPRSAATGAARRPDRERGSRGRTACAPSTSS